MPQLLWLYSEFQLFFDIGNEVVCLYANLLHGIAVADCYTAVVFGIEIICDAERRAYLILAAIAFAYGACLIIIDGEVLCEIIVNLHSLIAELL